MQSKSVILIIIVGMLTEMFSSACTLNSHAAEPKKKLMAHYMPWYVSEPFTGYWGWHWIMNYSKEKAVNYGQAVMCWLQEHCFSSQAYLTVDNRPALFVFGPQYFTDGQWNQLFSVLPQSPFFYTLSRSRKCGDGVFGWPPMHGHTTTLEQWHGYLANLYAENRNGTTCVGTVFPQFHDIYEKMGVHKSYGFLDAQGVKTFEATLDMALRSNCEFIQLVTFNDYGEGTMIEPTVEFGYRYLEIIQQRQKQEHGRLFSYSAEYLRLPVTLYRLKKKHQHNRLVMEALAT